MSKHDKFVIMEILQKLRARHVVTDRDKELNTQIERLFNMDENGRMIPEALRFTSTGETRGIMVVDGPGGGKSTLVARALKRHTVLSGGDSGRPHYLSAVVPSPATFKSMMFELLKQTGYANVSTRRDMWSVCGLLRSRMADMGVGLLVIDEAHDLFCADRNLILRALKFMMQGDEAFALILIGTGRLEEILRSDPQVWRRFTPMRLTPVHASAEQEALAALIDQYCATAGIEPSVHPELVFRLVHAARQRFGLVIELIIAAIEQALIGGHRALDIDHFAAAYALQEACSEDKNVFLASNWMAIDPDNPDGLVETARSKKSRKK